MPARERRSGITIYDHRHQQARRDAARRHHPSDPCSRCGHPLGPMTPALHLDHDDRDPTRTTYLGFSHGSKPCPTCRHSCNTRAGAIKGNRTRKQTRWTSRTW